MGLEKAAYCRKKKLIPSSFYAWEEKINSSDPSQPFPDLTKESLPQFEGSLKNSFIPLDLSPVIPRSSPSTNSKIEVMFPQGHRLSLEGSYDWEKLTAWLTPLLTTED